MMDETNEGGAQKTNREDKHQRRGKKRRTNNVVHYARRCLTL